MIKKDVFTTLAELPKLIKVKKLLRPRPGDTRDCLGARVATNAARIPRRSAFVCEGQTMDWQHFNAAANR